MLHESKSLLRKEKRMRSKRLVAAVVAATALAAVPVAAAGMMHSVLGAHLSGMGEHGIVNLTSHAAKGQLCWKFDLHVMHPLASTVRDKGGMTVARLGHMYSAKGCAMVPKTALRSIESKPGSYWVWVATKGHPGDLRGKLFAGMAHM
jgi:hypothetical protein